MKTKKPKAWRGCMSHMEHPGPDVRRLHGRETGNCTVIPDGAAIPLPADVRRVTRALAHFMTASPDRREVSRIGLWAAWQLHLRAEKRRRGGK